MALALAIGAVGALWVIFRADLSALLAFEVGRGEAIYFWGCVAHAIYTPMVARLNRGENPIAFTFGMLCAGTLILGTLGAPAILATDWAALPGIVWITIAYTAFAASAATFVLLQYATLRLPSAKVMAYTYLTPSWVILWQVALAGEVPASLVLGGVALTVFGALDAAQAGGGSSGAGSRRSRRAIAGPPPGTATLGCRAPFAARSHTATIKCPDHNPDRRTAARRSRYPALPGSSRSRNASNASRFTASNCPKLCIQMEASRSASGSSLHHFTRPTLFLTDQPGRSSEPSNAWRSPPATSQRARPRPVTAISSSNSI